MDVLCFATYARALQGALSKDKSDEKITDLLLRFVIDMGDVRSAGGDGAYAVDAKIANRLLNRDAELYTGIREASGNPDVIDGAVDYFEESVMDFINENRRLDLLSDIRRLIENDETISAEKKEELLKSADDHHLTRFLANTFIYALSKPNKIKPDGRKKKSLSGARNTHLISTGDNTMGVVSEETLKSVVQTITSALYATDQSEIARFRDFKDAEFHKAVQGLIRSGKMTYHEFYQYQNFLEIAKKADAELSTEDYSSCHSTDFEFDWLIRFFNAARDVSDDEMQKLWAKVLAREITQKDHFSLRAIEMLRNMSKDEAEAFNCCRDAVAVHDGQTRYVGHYCILKMAFGDDFYTLDFFPHSHEIEYQHGNHFSRNILKDSGLVYEQEECKVEIEKSVGWGIFSRGKALIIGPMSSNYEISFWGYPMTPIAIELLPLIQSKEDDDNLIEIGKTIKNLLGKKLYIAVHDLTEEGDLGDVDYLSDI